MKLPAILSDGMVLQRERSVKIWGNADKGESVTVVLKEEIQYGSRGRWKVVGGTASHEGRWPF